MSLRTLSDIKLPIGTSEEELVKLATKKLGKKPNYFAIKKKSLDARNKSDLKPMHQKRKYRKIDNLKQPLPVSQFKKRHHELSRMSLSVT